MFVGEFRLFILVFWINFYSRKQLFLKCVESLIEQNKYLNKIVKEVIRKVYVYSKQRLGNDINVKRVVIDVGNGYWKRNLYICVYIKKRMWKLVEYVCCIEIFYY